MDLAQFFTTDEELEDLEDRDATTNIIGYVETITAPVRTSKENHMLFKFTLSNSTKRIEILIWDDLINKYCTEIYCNRVISINGGYCKAVIHPKFKQENNFVPFEIIVKENAEINFLGYYMLPKKVTNELKKVTFDNIHTVEGLIEIAGYIRTKFSLVPNRSGASSYGIGAITDGKEKRTIQVKQFTESQMTLGDYIIVRGTVKGQDSLVTVFCDNMNNIKLDPEMIPLTNEALQRGGRPVKRIHNKKEE